MNLRLRGCNVRLSFLWYDFWVGAFYDRANKALYFCPLPMCVIKISRLDT